MLNSNVGVFRIILRYHLLVWGALIITSPVKSQKYYEINNDHDSIIINHVDQKNSGIIEKKSNQFYDTLASKAEKRRITREVYDKIIMRSYSTDNSLVQKVQSESQYLKYKGKKIRNIKFIQLDVFGPTIEDTTLHAEFWIEKAGNALHFNTQKRVLQNELLFKEGDIIDPLILADNERIFRKLNFIQDVRFIIKPVPYSNSVDIYILIKDLWPVAFGFQLNSLKSATTGIWNRNFFGLGHELFFNTHWDLDQDSQFGYSGKYLVNNFGKSFFDLSFEFQDHYQINSYKFIAERTFFTPEIKYAGGYTFEKYDATRDIELLDSIVEDVEQSYNYNSIWFGRSFPFRRGNLASKGRSNIYITGKWMDYHKFRGPEQEQDLFYNYQSRTLFFVSLGISQQAHFKSNLIHGFGDTEDIPYGSLFALTTGYEWSSIKNRQYLAVEFSKGKYVDKVGYVYNSIKCGGFITNEFEQGVLSYSFSYFSPAIISNKLLFRFYFGSNYKLGIKRNYDEFLEINNKYDVRGLDSDELKGYKKLTFNFESRMFSSRHYYGFRPVFYVFSDFGLIDYSTNRFFINPWNSSVGFGIRIRNERLVFNTFQLRLAYFPLAPNRADKRYFEIAGRPEIIPTTFTTSEPKIIEF